MAEGEEALARGLCRVAVAAMERDTERLVAGQLPLALALTHFMLQCAQHPERTVVETTIDYFLHINTVPVDQASSAAPVPDGGPLARGGRRLVVEGGGGRGEGNSPEGRGLKHDTRE